MSSMWVGFGIGVMAVMALVMRSRRSSRSSEIDRGTVSTSWIAEHRAGPGEV